PAPLPSAARPPNAPSHVPVQRTHVPQASAKNAKPGLGAPGHIYDFVGGGLHLGQDTLAVSPDKDAERQLSRRASDQKGLVRHSLEVEITSSRGLRNADWVPLVGGTSDPYCLCQVQGAGKTKYQTKTVDNCTEPVWKESFSVDDFYEGDVLLFKVSQQNEKKRKK
ncbi:PLA2G4D, partial [Symbiodinium pilosum]